MISRSVGCDNRRRFVTGEPTPCQSSDNSAAACWLRCWTLLGQEPAFPDDAFDTERRRSAFRLLLRLRPYIKIVLLIYLLLAFFESPPSRKPPERSKCTPVAFAAPQPAIAAQRSKTSNPAKSADAFRYKKFMSRPLHMRHTVQRCDFVDTLSADTEWRTAVEIDARFLPALPGYDGAGSAEYECSRGGWKLRNNASASSDGLIGQWCVLDWGPQDKRLQWRNSSEIQDPVHDDDDPLLPLPPWMPRTVHNLLAVVCLIILSLYCFLNAKVRGVKRSPASTVPLIGCLVSVIDLLWSISVPLELVVRTCLIARLTRPLLVFFLFYPVFSMLSKIIRTLPQVWTIILALFLSVALFDWLGVILFAGTGGHEEFHSFQRGCISLLLVVTTVRLPQVLLCGYTVHEAAVLFIVVFYLLTAVLLGLFAAAFYSAYREEEVQEQQELEQQLRTCLTNAFALMERGDGYVSLETWCHTYDALNTLPQAHFSALQRDINGPSRVFRNPFIKDVLDHRNNHDDAILHSNSLKCRDPSAEVCRTVACCESQIGLTYSGSRSADSQKVDLEATFVARGVKQYDDSEAGNYVRTNCEILSSKHRLSQRRTSVAVEGEARILFESLAQDTSGSVTLKQFLAVPKVLTSFDQWKRKTERLQFIAAKRASKISMDVENILADVCVVSSLVITFLQTQKFIRTASTLTCELIEEAAEGMPASCFCSFATSYWLQMFLSVVYIIAVAIFIFRQWIILKSPRLSTVLRFDIILVPCVLLIEGACAWVGRASAFHPSCTTEIVDDLSRTLAFIRVLRGLRICFRIDPLKKLISCLISAVRSLRTVLMLLVILYYTYAVIGMELFCGLIECEYDDLPPTSSEADGDPTDWGLLNFNDFFSSLVTLFLLTVNGWDDSLKVLIKHTSVLKCSMYFVSFYILTDTILLNLLVALVLEAYEQVSDKRPKMIVDQTT